VIHRWAHHVFSLAGNVGNPIGRVADDFGRLRAAKARLVNGLLQIAVKGGADKQIEIGNVGQLL